METNSWLLEKQKGKGGEFTCGHRSGKGNVITCGRHETFPGSYGEGRPTAKVQYGSAICRLRQDTPYPVLTFSLLK